MADKPEQRPLTPPPDLNHEPVKLYRHGYLLEVQQMVPLPIAELIRRYGELYPVEMALVKVRCTGCQNRGRSIEPKGVRLCEPGCPRQRG